MFGRDVVSRDIYDQLHARCLRLEAQNADQHTLLVDALRSLAEAQRHAPRGETGRTPKAAPAGAVKAAPPVAPEADALTPAIVATAERYAFGDEAQRRRNLREAGAWRASGLEEAEIVARLQQGSYVDPDDAP